MPGGLLAPALETRPKKLWAWEAPRAVGEATHLPDLGITWDSCSTCQRDSFRKTGSNNQTTPLCKAAMLNSTSSNEDTCKRPVCQSVEHCSAPQRVSLT